MGEAVAVGMEARVGEAVAVGMEGGVNGVLAARVRAYSV